MKYKSWYPAICGQKRSTTWFAFFPCSIDGDIRWMEWVTVEWIFATKNAILPPCMPYPAWVKHRFVDVCPICKGTGDMGGNHERNWVSCTYCNDGRNPQR